MIYFDNASTSMLLPEVKQFIVDNLDVYGNPSSLHSKGYEAKEMLENARKTIAECINANPEHIFFTSGGTESNTQALNVCRGGNIAISSMEHPSVFNNAHGLYTCVHQIKPNCNGIITPDHFEKTLVRRTNIVSTMLVNNEIGTIMPIKEITEIAHKNKCIVHTDAVQAVGHIPVDVNDLGVDMLSASGHKFGAPRGIGFLYCNTDSNFSLYKLLHGGGQERGYRSGTENVIGAAAMALALKNSVDSIRKNMLHISEMRFKLLEELSRMGDDVRFNGSLTGVSGIINVSFKNISGEEIQAMLDDRDIAVSTGSACHSGIKTPSSTLVSIGVPDEFLFGTVRISLSHMNTMDEVDKFITNLKEVIEILKRY